MLRNPLLPRLLKKVHMQGGAPGTHPLGWVQARDALSTYVAASRERGGTHRRWAFFSSLVDVVETMRALVVARYGGRLELADRPVPRPGPGEVLVRVRASGLCGTDLHLLSGRMPLGELPRISGTNRGDVVGRSVLTRT